MADINDYLQNYQAVQSSLPTLTEPSPQVAGLAAQAAEAGKTLGALTTGQSDFSQKLEKALLEQYDYNKDLIEQRSKAQTGYLTAPSVAREKYADVFDPFARERLVSTYQAQALEPYTTLTDLLQQRKGNIADIVKAAAGGYQSQISGAEAYANTLANQYQMAWNQYTNQIQQQQQQQKTTQDLLSDYLGQDYKDRALQQALDIALMEETGRTSRTGQPTATETKQQADLDFLQKFSSSINNPAMLGQLGAENILKGYIEARPDLISSMSKIYESVTGGAVPGPAKESTGVAADRQRAIQQALTLGSRDEAEQYLIDQGFDPGDKVLKPVLDKKWKEPSALEKAGRIFEQWTK